MKPAMMPLNSLWDQTIPLLANGHAAAHAVSTFAPETRSSAACTVSPNKGNSTITSATTELAK